MAPRSATQPIACVRAWIQIKYHWALTLPSAKQTALQNMLATCCPDRW
ncbi:hypothetical protein ACQPYK_50225 (plasmid) [Streptosporangium sp. CA-135522]